MRCSPLWLIVLGLLLAGCVSTPQSVEPPAAPMDQSPPPIAMDAIMSPLYSVGDHWEYSDGYGLEVTKVEADGFTTMTHLDAKGQLMADWIQRRGIFKEASKIGDEFRQVVYRSRSPDKELFPLAIGRKIQYKREYLVNNKDLKAHLTSWHVVGRESIEVPAGHFDVWILDFNSNSVTSDWEGHERWFYSPQVKQYVRMEYQYGKAPPSSRVLMRYHLAP